MQKKGECRRKENVEEERREKEEERRKERKKEKLPRPKGNICLSHRRDAPNSLNNGGLLRNPSMGFLTRNPEILEAAEILDDKSKVFSCLVVGICTSSALCLCRQGVCLEREKDKERDGW